MKNSPTHTRFEKRFCVLLSVLLAIGIQLSANVGAAGTKPVIKWDFVTSSVDPNTPVDVDIHPSGVPLGSVLVFFERQEGSGRKWRSVDSFSVTSTGGAIVSLPGIPAGSYDYRLSVKVGGSTFIQLPARVLRSVTASGGGTRKGSCAGPTVNGYCLVPGADLAGANLSQKTLASSPDFDNQKPPDLRGANLTGANLTNLQLGGANINGANLTGANLTNVIFDGSAVGANFTDANFTDADLNESTMINANFTGATGLNDVGTSVAYVDWSGATCPNGMLEDPDINDCSEGSPV